MNPSLEELVSEFISAWDEYWESEPGVGPTFTEMQDRIQRIREKLPAN